MAKTAVKKIEKYMIEIEKNSDFCGVDICGIQFSHGKAETTNIRAVEWFREHDGYKVTEIVPDEAEENGNG